MLSFTTPKAPSLLSAGLDGRARASHLLLPSCMPQAGHGPCRGDALSVRGQGISLPTSIAWTHAGGGAEKMPWATRPHRPATCLQLPLAAQ